MGKRVGVASQVIRNLHVVFTMNPSSEGLKDRAATSPALFNRCVLNWFGDWSKGALYQVGKEFTSKMDLEKGGVCVGLAFASLFVF
jgi:dynein heavy chain 1